jgi:hypothetical protein
MNFGNGGKSVGGAETAEDGRLNLRDLVVAGSGEIDFGSGLCSGLRRMKESAVTVGGGETDRGSGLERGSWQMDKSLSAGKGPFKVAEGM